MIPAKTEKNTQTGQLSSRKQSAVNTKPSDSFAAVMAREQNGASSTGSEKASGSEKDASIKNATLMPSHKVASTKTIPKVARLQDTQGIPLNSATMAGRSPNDMLRMQSFGRVGSSDSSGLSLAGRSGTSRNLRVLAAGGNGRGFALANSDFIHTRNNAVRSSKNGRSNRRGSEDMGLGKLSARFESGSDGIAAIGYDSTGGTSYGKYQIASKVGSMRSFLSFLDSEAPDLSKRLRNAGPANTGSRRGAMPDAWRAIASEQPERFEQLQEAFIHQSHYKPALDAIEQCTGIKSDNLSAAMREVIWSTAVQHGPAGAAKIFARADDMSGKAGDANYERKLITNVYNVRAGQFGSSTSQVREAVRSRFRQERQLALNMLDGTNRATMA